MTLTPFAPLPARQKRGVEREAERLLAWLRPDAGGPEMAWKTA